MQANQEEEMETKIIESDIQLTTITEKMDIVIRIVSWAMLI